MSIDTEKKLWFSVYITRIWMFGWDGPYFALGPFRITNKTLIENLMGGTKKPSRPIIARVVDYESHYSYEKDVYKLFLEDGSTETREFKRLHQTNEKGNPVGNRCTASRNFSERLKEKCGY